MPLWSPEPRVLGVPSMWTEVWWTWLSPCPPSHQALPFVEAAGRWLEGPDHQVAGCVLPWLGVVPELVLAHWWAEVGSEMGGCGAGLLKSGFSLLVSGVGS